VVFLQVLVLLVFGALAVQLWRLQILKEQEYQGLADVNRFRLVSLDAPRGVIYDRDGRLLVRNVPNYVISIVPGVLPDEPAAREAVLTRLSQLLDIPVSSKVAYAAGTSTSLGIEEILEANSLGPYTAVPIKSDVDKQIALMIEEEHLYLPGAVVEVLPLREYPTGAVTSDVVGYSGPIPSEQVADYLNQSDEDYTIQDPVGLMGVEASYEKELRGRKGLRHVEVDAFEREVQVLATDSPQPGNTLLLTLDLELQQAAESALREGMYRVNSTAGVVVAMNPQTGEVLAMVSLPSYDNNLFARGISVQDYQALSDDPERPLVNHAISGQYPPGSAFKIVASAAGLQEKVITQGTHLTCKGNLLLPNKYFPDDPLKAQVFKCWYQWGHGSLSILDAIALSCDIYFYQVGGGFGDFVGLGMDKLRSYATAFGFGELTGIALPGEAMGLVPDDQWKRVNYGEPWVLGDTYNAVIGQGYVLATPLQLLNAAAAVANGGSLYRPQLVYRVLDAQGYVVRDYSPELIGLLPVSAENMGIVQQGMRLAVTKGTANRANLREIAVAGKTGTAEYAGPLDAEGNLPSHAWFITYAPYEEPEIALVVFVSGGYNGAQVAVPIAAKILRSYFGLPQPTGEDIVAPPPGD
jgi:penicillin-binding protein 2